MKKINSLNNEEKLLIKSAKIASSKAIRSSKALGLTIKFIEKNSIIEITSNGKNILRTKKVNPSIDLSKLKKGSILVRK
jgi:hypothetical protein